jgi:hypothetical protein
MATPVLKHERINPPELRQQKTVTQRYITKGEKSVNSKNGGVLTCLQLLLTSQHLFRAMVKIKDGGAIAHQLRRMEEHLTKRKI